MSKQPVAFMSYVRFDDEHENGRLTEFRKRLSAEVRMQTGEEFPIFQDRNDILWGQNWEERIEKSLDVAAFLIPIITPSFFKSPPCCAELKRFLEREKKLKRNDLVLPVYYIDSPSLNDESKLKGDKLAQAISAHQWADWRELRFEPLTTPLAGKTLAQLAVQIRAALERTTESRKASSKQSSAKKRPRLKKVSASSPRRSTGEQTTQATEAAESNESDVARQIPSQKNAPPTRIVDPMHRGDHSTISDAIEKAQPGDRILVRPGLYQEGLVINKPLEIVGDGAPGEVVIQKSGGHVIQFKTTMGRVSNLTLRQMGDGKWYSVDIAQGRLELEDCDITSQSLACVGIHGGADPRLRRNRIHDGKQGGVLIYNNSQGTLEDNDIFGNGLVGVEFRGDSNPTLRRNRIHDGKTGGVLISENSQGTLEDNDIFSNGVTGVQIKTGGNPTLRHNRIHDGKQGGVLIYDNGQGTLEDNDIFGNDSTGVEIREGGNPIIRRNRINRNVYQAVYVHDGGGGTIEDNDLRDNPKGAWFITADCEPNVKRARNKE